MATHKPIIIVSGQAQQLPDGDFISGTPGSAPEGKTLGYTAEKLTSVVSDSGTKTLAYIGGQLSTIQDTATMTLSTFGYTSGRLTSITVEPLLM
jgi:hypothetical protein